jgi:hypothetical protein
MELVIFGIVAGVVGVVAIVMPIVYKMDKNNLAVERLRLEKETALLQAEADERTLKRLEAENRQYDRLLAERQEAPE